MADHDGGYKRLFSHPEMMADLLRGFVREDWVADLDFTSLTKYPTTFINEQLRERRDDVIWRLRRGSEDIYIDLLLEFQSGVNPYMAVRMLNYLGLLYQDLIHSREIAADGRLPPVLPIVLYNGRRRWNAAQDIADLIAHPPGQLENYRPRLRYLLIDESAYDDANLAALHNLVAALFRLENSRDPQPVREVLTALADWLQAPEQLELRHSFVLWLKQVFLRTRLPGVALPELNELEEIHAMLNEDIIPWTELWRQDGLRAGLQQGLQQSLEAERRLLLRLIRRRFDGTTAEQSIPLLERIKQSADFEDLGEALLDCANGDAWLTQLRVVAESCNES